MLQPVIKSTFLALLLTLTACGGGSGGSGGGDKSDPGFKVSDTTPAHEAVDVSPDAILAVSFNKDIFAKSATDDSGAILLKRTGSSTELEWQVVADTARSLTIEPDLPLALLTNYTVTVTDKVTDIGGTPLSAEHNWSFTTRDGAWGDTAQPVGEAKAAALPEISVDKAGNALAVWRDEIGINDSAYSLYASYYDVNAGSWEPRVELYETKERLTSAWAFDAKLDSDGNAMVVWFRREPGNKYQVFARYRSFDAASWEDTKLISDLSIGKYAYPSVGFDSSGNAMAVWTQEDSNSDSILAFNQYDATANSWGTPKEAFKLDGVASSSHFQQALAVDQDGNAVVVWPQDVTGTTIKTARVYANRYRVDTGVWTTKKEIGRHQAENQAKDLRVTFDGSGNAFAAWWLVTPAPDNNFHAFVNRFDSLKGGWGTSTRLKATRQDECGRHPSVAANANGRALVAFECGEIYSSHYRPDSDNWSAVEKISKSGGSNVNVSMDSSGNATAVWAERSNSDDLAYANRYNSVEGTWQGPAFIGQGANAKANLPKVATDASGQAVSIWQDDNFIFYNRFSAE